MTEKTQKLETATRTADVDMVQSSQYSFPYHHIPNTVGFPYFSRHWGFAASYIAALNIATNWLTSQSVKEGHRHMDFGCGDGGFVTALAQNRCFNDVTFEGVDTDEGAISWAQKFSNKPDQFRAIDVAKLAKQEYDSGTLIEVLEHIPPDECDAFIKSIAETLKPAASLFVTVPSVEKMLIEKHYRHFDFPLISECFSRYFVVEECFGFEKKSKMMKLGNRLMRNRRIHMETEFTSKREIQQLSRKHQQLEGCGRIGVILKKTIL